MNILELNTDKKKFAQARQAIKLYIPIIFFTLFACTNLDDGGYIDLDDLAQVNSNDIFSTTKLVLLEASPESMISTISQVEYFDEQYYVFDRRQQAIFCFNKEGDYLFKVHEQGHGPGEYIYVQSFTIDRFNNRLILLSPSVSELIIFDMDGNFLSKKSLNFEGPMGVNFINVLDGNTLMLSSINNYQSILYCLEDEIVKEFLFQIPSRTGALMPLLNSYQFSDSVFVLPYLSLEVFNVNSSGTFKHFEMDVRKDKNSPDQISLINSHLQNETPDKPLGWHDIVGKGRYLDHHILKILESTRFRLAVIIHDDAVKHLVIDKRTNDVHVFKEFAEGFVIQLFSSIQDDNYLISFDRRYPSKTMATEMHGVLSPYFTANFYDVNSLNADCQELLKNHDLLLDNPYLIVHKFRE